MALRIAADGSTFVLGFVSGVITARLLGDTGKGHFAVITMIGTVLFQFALMGLPDAAIVWAKRQEISFQRALSTSTTAAFMVALALAAILVGLSPIVLPAVWNESPWAIVLGATVVPLSVLTTSASYGINFFERFAATSIASIASAITTTALMWILLKPFDLGLLGAFAATIGGLLITLLLLGFNLRRSGLKAKPALDRPYLKKAARYGFRLQLSGMLSNLAARLDILFVAGLVSAGASGSYSVALTAMGVIAIPMFALAVVAFPRISGLDDDAATALTTQLVRVSLLPTMLLALIAGLLTPYAVPFLFGDDFRPAVNPALVLYVAAVPASLQFMLCRARSARKDSQSSLYSYLTSLVVMVIFDLILIPQFGIVGAAVASLISSVAGLVVVLLRCRQGRPLLQLLKELTPTRSDVFSPIRIVRQSVGR